MESDSAPPFDPALLQSDYEELVSMLGRWHPLSVIDHAITALFAVAAEPQKMRQYQPWHLLLLIQWTMRTANQGALNLPPANLNDFHQLVNKFHAMDGHSRMPTEYSHLIIFLRLLAIRQFWLQQDINGDAFARQWILFGGLPSNHQFSVRFQQAFGASLHQALELSFILVTPFLQGSAQRFLRRSEMQNMDRAFSPAVVDSVIARLSRIPAELQQSLDLELGNQYSIEEQLQMDTCLLDYPFLRLGDHLFPYSPILLYRSLPSLAYRTLKSIDPNWFCSRFGAPFEDYLASGLHESAVSYLRESDLKKMLPGTGQVIDFLIQDNDAVLLVDAKSVELSWKGKVSHRPKDVFSAIKSSAWKGIEQGIETAARLKNAILPEPFVTAGLSAEIFLLIVTHEPLHLGSGKDFASAIASEAVKDLEARHGGQLLIPFENVFFLSVDEFDRMLERVRTGVMSLGKMLLHARENNKNSTTKKFEFIQHLESINHQTTRPPRLEKALKALLERAEKHVQS